MEKRTKVSQKHQQILQRLIRLPVGLNKIKNERTRESGFTFMQENVRSPWKEFKMIVPKRNDRNRDPNRLSPEIQKATESLMTPSDVYHDAHADGFLWQNGMFEEANLLAYALKYKTSVSEIKNELMPEIMEFCDTVYEHLRNFATDAQLAQKYHMEMSDDKLYSNSQYETLIQDVKFFLPQEKLLLTVTYLEAGSSQEATYFHLFNQIKLDKETNEITYKVRTVIYMYKMFCLVPTEYTSTHKMDKCDSKLRAQEIHTGDFYMPGWYGKNYVEHDADKAVLKKHSLGANFYLHCLLISLKHELIPQAIVETPGVEPGVVRENLTLKKKSDLRFEPKWKYTTIVLRDVNPEHQEGPGLIADSDKPKTRRAFHAVNMHPRKTAKGYTWVRAHFRGDKSLGVTAHDYDVRVN